MVIKIKIKNGVTYVKNILVVNKTYSLPADYGNGLKKITLKAFSRMKREAKKSNLNIYISSGFRSYYRQKKIYEKYVKKDGVIKADTYSARAGHSEHQSGLSIDVNQIDDTFSETKESFWLEKNCYKFGFILRYPKDKTNETGYKYEPWHFRYVGKKLAKRLFNKGDWLSLESYFGLTSEYK